MALNILYKSDIYTPSRTPFEMSLSHHERSLPLKGAILCCLKSKLDFPRLSKKSNKANL